MSLHAAVNEALLHVGEAAFLEKRTNATAHTDCAFKPDSADMIVDALCSEGGSKKLMAVEGGDGVHQPILSTDGTFGAGFESGLPALAKIAKKVTRAVWNQQKRMIHNETEGCCRQSTGLIEYIIFTANSRLDSRNAGPLFCTPF